METEDLVIEPAEIVEALVESVPEKRKRGRPRKDGGKTQLDLLKKEVDGGAMTPKQALSKAAEIGKKGVKEASEAFSDVAGPIAKALLKDAVKRAVHQAVDYGRKMVTGSAITWDDIQAARRLGEHVKEKGISLEDLGDILNRLHVGWFEKPIEIKDGNLYIDPYKLAKEYAPGLWKRFKGATSHLMRAFKFGRGLEGQEGGSYAKILAPILSSVAAPVVGKLVKKIMHAVGLGVEQEGGIFGILAPILASVAAPAIGKLLGLGEFITAETQSPWVRAHSYGPGDTVPNFRPSLKRVSDALARPALTTEEEFLMEGIGAQRPRYEIPDATEEMIEGEGMLGPLGHPSGILGPLGRTRGGKYGFAPASISSIPGGEIGDLGYGGRYTARQNILPGQVSLAMQEIAHGLQ